MDHNIFDNILEAEFDRVRSVLSSKADEYADKDRLHNFKVAATLSGQTPSQAVAGMMVKHVVSVFDMLKPEYIQARGFDHPSDISMDVWNEKLGDAINYLFLLKAAIIEEKGLESGYEDLIELPIDIRVKESASTQKSSSWRR